MSTPTRRHPFRVRQQRSGYTGFASYIVVKLTPGGARRVSVYPHTVPEGAQAEADALNVGEMVRPAAEDPRPYEVRRAEAECAYYREQGR